MSDEQLERRIRASLARRAEAVRVEPDLAGLAERAGQSGQGGRGGFRRVRTRRVPLLAVAIAIAALAVTTVALEPAGDRGAHLMARAGSRTETPDDPTSTTDTTGPTSAPKPSKRPSTSTTASPPPDGPTATTAPAAPDGAGSVPAADAATPAPTGADATVDGAGSGAAGPPPDCFPLLAGWMYRVAWSQGSDLALVDLGQTGSTRQLALYVPVEAVGAVGAVGAFGYDGCYRRVTDPDGTPTVLEVSTTANSETEIHTLGCRHPLLVIPDGSTTDGVTWTFRVREIEVMGSTARTTLDTSFTAGQGESATIDVFRRLDCNDSTPS